MRILLINSVCGIRSTGRICTEIAEKYISEGHECKIAYGRETAPEKYKSISYKIGNDFDLIINALKSRIFDNEGYNARKQTESFLSWAEKFNPDLVWLHNLHGYYINVEMLFNWIKSRPKMKVKWTLHDCWAFTGHCSHFSFKKCDKWKSGCNNCIQRSEYPASFLIDNSEKNYKRKRDSFSGINQMTIITPSKWLADLVNESFLKGYLTKVVHNTIDKAIFKPTISNFREKYNLNDKIIVLGVATAWGEKKGLNDFIALSEMLDNRYKVVLVGLSKKQIKKIPQNILCIQKTNNIHELAEIYTAADVFLNLTYEDTYPTVNLEAQACGTPCITYRTGGSVESVQPKNIIEQGDINGVANILKTICRN